MFNKYVLTTYCNNIQHSEFEYITTQYITLILFSYAKDNVKINYRQVFNPLFHLLL